MCPTLNDLSITGLENTTGSVFTKHSQEKAQSFYPRFCKFESKTTFD